jgi:hypothetical protein
MDFDNNGVKPSAVSDKAIDSVDETAAAPFVCTKSNSNGTSAYYIDVASH